MGKGIRFLIPISFSWLLPHGGMGTIRGMKPLPPRLGRPSRCSEQRVPWMGPRPQGATPVRGCLVLAFGSSGNGVEVRRARRSLAGLAAWSHQVADDLAGAEGLRARGAPSSAGAAALGPRATAHAGGRGLHKTGHRRDVGHRLALLGSSSPGAVRRVKQRCAGEALRGRAQRAPRWKRFRRPRRWSRAGRSRARAPPPSVGSVPAATAGPWLQTSQAFALKPEGESEGPGLKRRMVAAPRCIEGAAGSSRPHADGQGKGVAAAVVPEPWARIHH
jgi:hypothetical protein